METRARARDGLAASAALAIWGRLLANGFRGADPYDALSARRIPKRMLENGHARRGLTQAVKRSPLPLQGILGIPAGADPYTFGHALLACARLHRAGLLANASDEVEPILGALRRVALSDGDSSAWGYHFPVHTRFFSYEPTTPNLIATAFVAKGLAAVTAAGLADCREDLRSAATFVLHRLPRVVDESGHCFGYIQGEPAVVHNANTLAALMLCDAADACGEEVWVAEALACARFTVARQARDGSWPYSEEPYGRWVDGFHTGFVLEGLARVVAATGDDGLRESLGRGVDFYVAQLFGPSGEPKCYPQRAWPLDVLSAAQGVETLHVALGGAAGCAVPGQLEWIRRHIVRADGRVAYQVHRAWTDWREFPRWSSAPLMSALAGVVAGVTRRWPARSG